MIHNPNFQEDDTIFDRMDEEINKILKMPKEERDRLYKEEKERIKKLPKFSEMR